MATPTIDGPRHALMTGAVLGMLIRAKDDNLIRLRPVATMDGEGNYTNRIELREPEDDSTIFIITVDQAF